MPFSFCVSVPAASIMPPESPVFPPPISLFSNTITEEPASAAAHAAAQPVPPPPTITTSVSSSQAPSAPVVGIFEASLPEGEHAARDADPTMPAPNAAIPFKKSRRVASPWCLSLSSGCFIASSFETGSRLVVLAGRQQQVCCGLVGLKRRIFRGWLRNPTGVEKWCRCC